jgi:hypothetical protein
MPNFGLAVENLLPNSANVQWTEIYFDTRLSDR